MAALSLASPQPTGALVLVPAVDGNGASGTVTLVGTPARVSDVARVAFGTWGATEAGKGDCTYGSGGGVPALSIPRSRQTLTVD